MSEPKGSELSHLRLHLYSARAGQWHPNRGERIRVVRGNNEHEAQHIGKEGVVIKNCGMGIFEIRCDDGQTLKLKTWCFEIL